MATVPHHACQNYRKSLYRGNRDANGTVSIYTSLCVLIKLFREFLQKISIIEVFISGSRSEFNILEAFTLKVFC